MWEPQGMYSKFLLKQPTILFGENAIMGLKTYACSRVVVIHGSSLNEEYKDKMLNALSSFEVIFAEKSWEGEPSIESLFDTIGVLENVNPDLIIAIGGGSVIDGAKMVRTLYEFPFFDINETKFSLLNWKTTFVAIPSTIGSGAEISSASVLYNSKIRSKEFIISHQFIPEIIVLESVLIANAPKKLLISSMVDALSHSIEGYMSNIENIMVDSYAEKAIQIISQYYGALIGRASNDDLNKLQLASLFSGLVQNHCIVGATHSLAHQMFGYGISHSSAIALFLQSVIEENIKDRHAKERFEKLALNSGFISSDEILVFVSKIVDLCDLESERITLFENRDKILSDNSFFDRALADKGGQGNPVPMSRELLQEIFKSASS